ncbi:unnamed protein product, partial [Bubo scandiacus]
MEVSPTELMNILNKVTDGFGLDTCRSMVAVMDSDTTGKLGFEEFKYLWNNIKKWQCVYKQFDTDHSGTIGAQELPGAFEAAGFRLPPPLWGGPGPSLWRRGGEPRFRQLHQLPRAPRRHVPCLQVSGPGRERADPRQPPGVAAAHHVLL